MIPKITEIIPHRPPMVMIDSLVESNGGSAKGTKVFTIDDYGAEGNGVVEPVLVECLAQTVAAMSGYQAHQKGTAVGWGMLVGVSEFEIYGPAKLDRELHFSVKVEKEFGPFLLVDGLVEQHGKMVARGKLKFYIEEKSEENEKKGHPKG